MVGAEIAPDLFLGFFYKFFNLIDFCVLSPDVIPSALTLLAPPPKARRTAAAEVSP